VPDLSTALRQLVAGRVPGVPSALPSELQQLLAGIVQAIGK
jgi:hypothetical protein